MSRLRPHLSYANVMATIAVFVAMGGTSYAVSQLPRNSVGVKQVRAGAIGASEIKSGAVRSKDIGNRSVALTDIAVDARRSLRGQTGAAGPPGPSFAPLSAAVLAGGDFARSRGTSGNVATHGSGTGVYKVDFNRDVSSCYAVATISRSPTQTSSGAIAAEMSTVAGEQNSVYVYTSSGSPGGAPQDLPFHLIVSC